MDDRTQVIRLLEDAFRNDPRVYALWLEGSDGLGRSDAYSDLDVWLDVADGDEQAVLDACAAVLQTLRPIDFEVRTDNPHPKIFQRCLHLAGTSPYLLLDLCVQSHSRARRAAPLWPATWPSIRGFCSTRRRWSESCRRLP